MFAVILTVPRVAALRPSAAPAIIKGIIKSKGLESQVLDSQGNILVDKFINIDTIAIDGIKLTDRELHTGEFWPVYSLSYVEDTQDLPDSICPNLYLGHNGTWRYRFFAPFTEWIIRERKQGPQLDNTIFKSSQQTLEDAKSFFKDIREL